MIDTKEQLHQRLKDIKTQLRLSMNGVVSQSMREKGLVYKLNFGVELPRIKGIAAGYEKLCGKKISESAKYWRDFYSR